MMIFNFGYVYGVDSGEVFILLVMVRDEEWELIM